MRFFRRQGVQLVLISILTTLLLGMLIFLFIGRAFDCYTNCPKGISAYHFWTGLIIISLIATFVFAFSYLKLKLWKILIAIFLFPIAVFLIYLFKDIFAAIQVQSGSTKSKNNYSKDTQLQYRYYQLGEEKN